VYPPWHIHANYLEYYLSITPYKQEVNLVFFVSEAKFSCSSPVLTGQAWYLNCWGICCSSITNFISTELVHGFLEINTAVFQ
jgi:hypothetical protein